MTNTTPNTNRLARQYTAFPNFDALVAEHRATGYVPTIPRGTKRTATELDQLASAFDAATGAKAFRG